MYHHLRRMVRQGKKGALTASVNARQLWGPSPFFLIDVGCSGGIDTEWHVFGDRLRAVGFDPLVAEIERLNSVNTLPGVRYEVGHVTSRNYEQVFPAALRDDVIATRNDHSFPRVSARAVQSRSAYIQEHYNAGATVELSKHTVILDDRLDVAEHPRVDFLKSDTDGHDLEVVLGADAIMASGGLLGIKVEARFQGALHPYANTFENINRTLRQRGYSLFDLSQHRYSRSALPAPFAYELPAQTTSGQIIWGDALYFRDLASTTYEQMWPYEVTAERVLKLACLYDLFDLPDCAAELILNRRDLLDPSVSLELLDQLATGEPQSYEAHIAAFEKDFRAFYPSRLNVPREHQASTSGKSDAVREKIQSMRRRIEKLTAENELLRQRLKSRRARIEQLTQRLQKTERKPEHP